MYNYKSKLITYIVCRSLNSVKNIYLNFKEMKTQLIGFILFNLLILFSCNNENKDLEYTKSDGFTIREIPMRLESEWKGKSEINIFFAVNSITKKANYNMIDSIDQYVCLNIIDTIDMSNYSSFIITFLKETENTKLITSGGISDTSNPMSSSHFVYVDYLWLYGSFYEKRLNDWNEIIEEFECE